MREALKLALSTLDEVRSETFRLLRNGQKLYAEEKVWNTIIAIKQALAQPEQEQTGIREIRVTETVKQEQELVLQDIEQYRLQMAGISTAAIGYWKESDGILPDFDTVALRDVAKLYSKYDALYKARWSAQPTSGDYALGYAEGFNDACKKPEQAPYGWIDVYGHFWNHKTSEDDVPLYTTPPKREWVGLTDEEVKNLWLSVGAEPIEVRLIEAKLKEKNT